MNNQTSVLTPSLAANGPSERKKCIIVIGAGLAGLGAARALIEHDCEVIVLEARNRIGGRCFTRDAIDEGAHWIHGTDGNPITTLARQLSIDTFFVGGDSTYSGGWEPLALYGADATPFTGEDKLHSILLADEVRDDLDAFRRQQLAHGGEDMSLRDAMRRVLAERTLTEVDQVTVDWHTALFARDDCGGGDTVISFLWWDEGYEVYGYGDSVLTKGYSALTSALAEGLDIRLEHIVQTIQYDDRGGAAVTVTTNRGVFESDAVVVTLPLGVLKSGVVSFQPPLPARKCAAISRLEMGNLLKVTVRFDAPFWPLSSYVFGYCCAPIEEHPTTIINLWKTHKIPVLQMLVGGEAGRAMECWSEDATRAWTLNVLRDVFGDRMTEPREIRRTMWGHDPFSRGAYSCIPVGATPDDIEALAEPVHERVFFAGEATYRHHWACTHGAYASGLRAAARIANDATILPPRNFTENRRWRDMMMRASRFFNTLSTSLSAAEIKDRLAVLTASDVFSHVPESELRVLAMMFEPVEFPDSHVICRAGDPASEVYAVAAGQVEVRDPDGALLLVLEHGGVVGEYGLFGDGVRTATLIACGPCKALALDYQRFQRFLLAFPESALALLKLTVKQLLERNAQVRLLSQR